MQRVSTVGVTVPEEIVMAPEVEVLQIPVFRREDELHRFSVSQKMYTRVLQLRSLAADVRALQDRQQGV